MARSGRRNRTGLKRDAAENEEAIRLNDTHVFLLLDSSSITQSRCGGCKYVSGSEDEPMVLIQSPIRNGRRYLRAPLCIEHVDRAVAFFEAPEQHDLFETATATQRLLSGGQQCPICWGSVDKQDAVFKTQNNYGDQPLIHDTCADEAAATFDAVWNYSGHLLSTEL